MSTCIGCGKKFKKIRWSQVYCDRWCRHRTRSRARKLKAQESGEFVTKGLRLRFEILKRDNFKCQYCGRNPTEDDCKLQVDHIIPKSKGGSTIRDNLITSCEECNLGKGDILLNLRNKEN